MGKEEEGEDEGETTKEKTQIKRRTNIHCIIQLYT